MPCDNERQLARRVSSVAGDLLLTNDKLRFVGFGDGWELPWHKILNVDSDADRAIEVVATQKRGAGRYYLRDAEYVATVGTTLVQMSKRQIVGRTDTIDTAAVRKTSRPLSMSATAAGAVNAERGATLSSTTSSPQQGRRATSVNNLQLLCRRCNLKKGDRL